MKTFKDSTGKEWIISIDLMSLERVIAIAKVNLTKLFDDEMKLLSELFDDSFVLIQVLLAIIDPTQDMDAETRTKFIRAMKGDCLEAAANALVEDVIDFFPNPRRRELLRATVAKMWETVNAVQDVMGEKIASLDPTQLISATSSPESPELTPAT